MPIDLKETYGEVESKVVATKTYKEVKLAYKEAIEDANGKQKEFQESKTKLVTQLDQLQKATGKKRFERDAKTQSDRLFDLLKLQGAPGNVSGKTMGETTNFLRAKYVEAVNRVQGQAVTIFIQELKKLLGCDQQQKYNSQVLDIPIKSIDLFGALYDAPDSKVGTLHYETYPIVVQQTPFAMNRELFELIMTGQEYSVTNGQIYYGFTGRELFDIQYIDSIESYRITLKDRIGSENLISDFINDYYQTIDVLDTRALWTSIINNLLNFDYIVSDASPEKIKEESQFSIILKRILGLCFDDRQEIDVAGTSKVPELDGVDEEFFEMTDIDLREIDATINDAKLGVVQFQDCNVVNLPVNTQGIYNNLTLLDDQASPGKIDQLVNKIFDNIGDSPGWPKQETLKISLNTKFIREVAVAIFKALLSPKVLLPMMIMLKSLQQSVVDTITSLVDFSKKFKTLVINVVSKLGALFVKILYDLIVKDIKELLRVIARDILKNKKNKKVKVILQLLQIIDAGVLVAGVVSDYRKCKNLIDSILNAIRLALKQGLINVPAPLLALADARGGFDNTRAFLNVLEEYQKIGIPTGPMPDGSPNIGLLAKLAEIVGVESERDANGVTKQLITAADIGLISQVGFVTKSGIIL